MTYFWIRKEDLQNQEIIDEAVISNGVSFVKVSEAKGAIIYNTEHKKERSSYGSKSVSHKPCAV